MLKDVTKLEELIAGSFSQPAPPAEFKELPWLKGRAQVAFELKRPNGKVRLCTGVGPAITRSLAVVSNKPRLVLVPSVS